MSTLASSLNSLAASAVTDFYRPLFGSDKTDRHYLNVSRWLTAGWGAIQIAVAVLAISMQQRVVDAVLAVASFTNGPILGLFFLGVLTRRVGPRGALAGVVTGVFFMLFVWLRLSVSWQWYVLLGSTVTFVSGLAASLLLERRPSPAVKTSA
jgi:Na+/proline symporter